jgi:hypothetical protein
VRGPKARQHVIEPNGEHVTSLRRPDAAHKARLNDGRIRPASEDEFQDKKGMAQYMKGMAQ